MFHFARSFVIGALAGLMLFAASASATAQERTYFKPAKHLDGYAEHQASKYAGLFDFDPFEERSSDFLDPDELEELRALWDAHVAEVTERIGVLETDPKEAELYRLEQKLAEHEHLGRISYRRIDRGPFNLFVQDPLKALPGYHESVADFYGDWLAELERVFRSEYVEPLELERKRDFRAYVVVVLATAGMYKDYADAVRSPDLYAARAHYDPQLRIAVTYQDAFGRAGQSDERHAALHEAVHIFEHAYYGGSGLPPRRMWLSEGLAEYLASHKGLQPGSLGQHALDRDALEEVVGISAANAAIANIHLLPIEELVRIKSYGDAVNHIQRRAAEMGGLYAGPEVALSLLYRQSSLWMHYLHRGEAGKYRARLLEYIGSAFRGTDDADAFAAAFDGVDFAVLDKGFRAYLNREAKKARMSARVAKTARPLSSGADSMVETVEATTGTAEFRPGALEIDARDPEVRFALALGLASAGKLSSAARELRELTGGGFAGEQKRWQRELDRVERAVGLRRRFLEHLRDQSKKLVLKDDGGRLLAVVKSVGDEFVELGSNHYGPDRKGIDRLALDDIDPIQLADHMRTSKYKFEPGWEVAYAYILAGDETWKKALDGSSAGAKSLLADARDDYPARLHVARATAELNRLAQSGVPTSAEAGAKSFEAIVELARNYIDLPLVTERLDALRALAGQSLLVGFDDSGYSHALRAPIEELADGRVRITYEFQDEDELEDFRSGPYLRSLGQMLGVPEPTKPRVSGGSLIGSAHHSLRFMLGFEGEARIACRLSFQSPRGAFDPSGWMFMLGICDDGEENHAHTQASGAVMVLDAREGYQRLDESAARAVTLEEEYELEICLEQDEIVSRIDGSTIARAPAGPRTAGGVFLWSNAGFAFAIDRLVIEGRVSEDSIAELRAAWIEAKLVDAGL